MKIVNLRAENIKKLVAVEITPGGNIVTISGKNGAGKTSVLDAIWWALAGTANIQGQPIRKGQTKARIRVDLGELVVERKFGEHGSSLSVENADGARFPSPQKMLDALLGELSFDPLAFARMQPHAQFDELRRVSQLDVDVDALDGLNRSDFAKRTDINRDAKAKRAQAEGILVPPSGGETPIDEAALVDELQRAGDRNTLLEQDKAMRASLQRKAEQLRGRAAELRGDAAKLEALAADAIAGAEGNERTLDELPPIAESLDLSAIQQKIHAARGTNAAIEQRNQAINRKATASAEAGVLEAQARTLTERMEGRTRAKTEAIARAKMPIPGLGFGDGVVTYNGIPFDQASSAEQLRVSLGIAMAANAKLRVIRIEDGSLLDEESMAAIAETAKANDYQFWIETVRSDGKCGIVIEDGSVSSTPESRAAREASAAA